MWLPLEDLKHEKETKNYFWMNAEISDSIVSKFYYVSGEYSLTNVFSMQIVPM